MTFANYAKVFEYPVLTWAINSVIQATIATALCVLFGAMAGYAIARLRFPGRDLLFLLFLAALMVPAEVTVVPLLLAFIKIGWASTYQALILPMIGNVFSVYIFRQFFLTFPKELEEAAIVDGAGRFQIFFKIALPLARSPAIAAAVIVFTLNWNNFLWPLLVTFDEDMKTHASRHRRLRPGDRHPHPARGLCGRDGGRHSPVHPQRAAVPPAAALLHPRHQRRQRQRVTLLCRPISSLPGVPCPRPPASASPPSIPRRRSRSPRSPAAMPPMSTPPSARPRTLFVATGPGVTPAARGRLLLRLADLVAAHKDELAGWRPRTSASR